MEHKDVEKLYIHILSPVHVGGGQEKFWMNGIHFHYDVKKKVVRIFNQEKLGKFLSENEVVQYANAIEKGNVNQFFEYLVQTRKIPIKDFSDEFYLPYRPEGDIKTMIRTGLGDPYLPGSSIKGAIRSAIFSWFYHNNQEIKRQIDMLSPNAIRRKDGTPLDKSMFGRINNNLMRFIQVSDAMFKHTVLFNTKVFNLFEDRREHEWYGGWKHRQYEGTSEEFKPTGFSSTYETLEMSDWSTVRIKVNKTVWELMGKYPENPRPPNGSVLIQEKPVEKLFEMINFATRKYILSELEFFKAFPAPNSDHIVSELDEILAVVPTDNKSCVLKMGTGTGFHAITGNWLFNDFNNTGFHEGGRLRGKKKYKSRKVSFSKFNGEDGLETLFFPMGFVKIYSQEAWDEA